MGTKTQAIYGQDAEVNRLPLLWVGLAGMLISIFAVAGCQSLTEGDGSPSGREMNDRVASPDATPVSSGFTGRRGSPPPPLWPLIQEGGQQFAVVGEVVDLAAVVYLTPEPVEPVPSAHPKYEASISIPASIPANFVYSVKVSRTINLPGVLPGLEVSIVNEGVVENLTFTSDSEGPALSYTLKPVPPLEQGSSYLFFLYRDESGQLNARAYSRFLVKQGQQLQIVDEGTLGIPAVKALAGLTVDEAAAKIEAAIAAAQAASAPVTPSP